MQSRRPWFNSWVGKICWRRDRLPTPVFLGFPDGSVGKESACNVGDLSSIPGLGRSPGEGKGYPLQYSGLENSMDCIVHGVSKLNTKTLSLRSLTRNKRRTTAAKRIIYPLASLTVILYRPTHTLNRLLRSMSPRPFLFL